MQLPPDLAQALEQALAGRSTRRLTETSGALSRRYRAPRDRAALLDSPDDALAYAAFRLPSTFAAVHAVLTEVAARVPGWQPRSVLDVGAGPGTASWAALSVWPDIEQVTCLERNRGMRDLGQLLAHHSCHPALREAEWRPANVGALPELDAHDLVVAAYVLNEVRPRQVQVVADDLWGVTGGVLAVVEPGTPVGYEVVLDVRSRLLERDAHMAAPCPHAGACPLAGHDWCHFAARVARSRVQRQVKGGQLSHEDEKFSYVALSREPVGLAGARIIRHPHIRSGMVSLTLCAPEGIRQNVVTRRDSARYARARKARWGDDLDRSGEAGPGAA